MKKKTRIKIQAKYLTPYLKSRIGAASALLVPQADLICKALAIDGKPKPDGVAPRTWAMSNALYIAQEGSAVGATAKAKKIRDALKSTPRLDTAPKRPTTTSRIAAPPPFKGDVTTDAFLASFQWRQLRMKVLKHYGRRCMCCGASPDSGAVMHVDHIKPRRLFPKLALDFGNLQVLCHECNHGKGNWDHTDWRHEEEFEVDPSVREFIRDIARSA